MPRSQRLSFRSVSATDYRFMDKYAESTGFKAGHNLHRVAESAAHSERRMQNARKSEFPMPIPTGNTRKYPSLRQTKEGNKQRKHESLAFFLNLIAKTPVELVQTAVPLSILVSQKLIRSGFNVGGPLLKGESQNNACRCAHSAQVGPLSHEVRQETRKQKRRRRPPR